MWIGHRKRIRKLTFRALSLRRSETIQQNQGIFYSYNNLRPTFEMSRIEPRWKANIGFFFYMQKDPNSALSILSQNYRFWMNKWICAFLDANVYQKQGKTLRTTRFQFQGINSKNRYNSEDEDQFKSHGHFVSKEARWNTALQHTLFKHFCATHVKITELK